MLAVVAWPILERIPLFGDTAISPHGIGTAAGFLIGAWMMIRRARRSGIGREVDDIGDEITRLLTWVGAGAIIGARGFYVLNHLDVYARDPLSALAIWHGGLTLLGGIVGGALVGLVMIHRRGWRAGLLLDAAAPGLAAGIAVGRLGDLAIGDHIGAPAPDFPLAWRCTGNLWERASNDLGFVPPQPYPAASSPVQGCFDVPVIQTALFDVLAAGATLLMILAVARWVSHRPVGTLTATFVAAYGTGRLIFDVFREDLRYGGLTASQWTSLVAVVIALIWLIRARRAPADDLAEAVDEVPTTDSGPEP